MKNSSPKKSKTPLKISVVTLFPEIIEFHLQFLPFKRAIEEKALQVSAVNLRNFSIDKRGSVDDKPYGGGTGMIIRPEPVFDAVESLNPTKTTRVIFLSPKGKKYNQDMAKNFAGQKDLIFVCGRYEGIDARAEQALATDIVSIGDYVLSGGEIASLVILEAVTRLLPGAIEKEDAIKIESFENNTLEYPQYTRPEEYKGMKVPDILLSGNHAEIEKWRKEHSEKLE